jgi:hypothetical protein
MCRQKPLSLAVGFEAGKYLLLFAGWSMRDFDHVVWTFVGAVVGARGQCFDWFSITTQFIGDHHPRFAERDDQSFEKAHCGFGVAACLHENVEYVAIRVDCTPEPVLLAPDRNQDFVDMPLVVWSWAIPPDAVCEMFQSD